MNTSSADGFLHDFLQLWLDGVVDKVIGDLDESTVVEFRKTSRRKKKLQTKLVTKRRSYDAAEKKAILRICSENKSNSEVVKEVRVLPGYENFHVSTLKRIKKEHMHTTTVDVSCKNVPKNKKRAGLK